MVGRIAAAALGLMAAVGMTPAAMAPVAAGPGIVVASPAQQQRAPTSTPIAISARDEVERVDEFAMASLLRRARSSNANRHRSPGDRAHKRMKHRRAAGRG